MVLQLFVYSFQRAFPVLSLCQIFICPLSAYLRARTIAKRYTIRELFNGIMVVPFFELPSLLTDEFNKERARHYRDHAWRS